MLEDKLLVLKCKHGSKDAMRRIYEKYKDYLLTLAKALLNEKTAAEDVVHDVFVSFAQSAGDFQLRGSLRGYLATCAANLARDRIRVRKLRQDNLDSAGAIISSRPGNPEQHAIEKEELARLRWAINQLPYEQREVLVLHLNGGMKFREVAKLQDVSIGTIYGRYRYGLDKLRTLLNSEVTK
ncbi:MAG: sigma-70 family RNA polymerase sigma factor [Sedimentisphaerales bacterium]|nr:sigma-70 family RNA polymerase sigma factor [Sedimentisphaerales bacterium]